MTPSRRKSLRKLLWLYFWLLIFEGALRKWILPGLSSPLLLVRDPVALLALLWGWPLLRKHQWRQWIEPLQWLGATAFLLAITAGHGDIPTAAYGARILVLQLPLIFLYAAVFDRSDVIRFAWALAWLSIPMTLLIVAQSNSPSSHFLNVAPGGEGTAVFSGAFDRFRPPGTFSFINGISSFYSLAASALFILVYGATLKQRGRQFTVLVGVALVVALPVSISRSLLFGYLQVLAALIAALAISRTRLTPIISGLLALVLAIGIGSNVPAFQETLEAYNARWEGAAAAEDGGDTRLVGAVGVFQNRFLGGFTAPLINLGNYSFLGSGIGISTNFGAQRLTGSRTFLVGEGGWEASLGEMGLPLGLIFLIWRLALGIWMLRMSLHQASLGNRLPLMLLGSSFVVVINGPLSQPTGLGFIVVSAGLTLAACNGSSFSPSFLIEAPQRTTASSFSLPRDPRQQHTV